MKEKKILIVDDDPDILNIYKHFLKGIVSEIVTTQDPLEVLELLYARRQAGDVFRVAVVLFFELPPKLVHRGLLLFIKLHRIHVITEAIHHRQLEE